MSWAARKQFNYFLVVVGFFVLIAALVIYPQLNKAPTCNDGVQDGAEQGIDCGGSCQKYCPTQVSPVIVKWARVFNVSDNIYSMVAYVENQNADAGIPMINYEFRVYDSDNVYLGSRSGTTFIDPNSATAIFEGSFDAGLRIPKRVTFAFTSAPSFIKVPKNFVALPVFGEAGSLSDADTLPKLNGTVSNETLMTFPNVEAVALVYDAFGNVIHASKTVIDSLPAQSKQSVFYTWREPFSGTPLREEIIPRVNIFKLN
jgi:hypothetical protein